VEWHQSEQKEAVLVENSCSQRRIAVGVALMAFGTVGLVAANPASAHLGAPVQASEPTHVTGNATCGDLAPDGANWTELKVEPVVNGTSSDGTLTVTIVVDENGPNGPTFDWTSDIGVDAVFVKGGPDGNLYLYDPESTGDSGLHAPTNPANGKYYGLSHVSFCYDEDDTTTTTSSTTTTSMPPGGGEMPPPGEQAPPPAVAVPRDHLPVTGRGTTAMLIGGSLLLAAGLALVAGSRRLLRS
jgi:hypothetical protein